jgi:hypothetical protein
MRINNSVINIHGANLLYISHEELLEALKKMRDYIRYLNGQEPEEIIQMVEILFQKNFNVDTKNSQKINDNAGLLFLSYEELKKAMIDMRDMIRYLEGQQPEEIQFMIEILEKAAQKDVEKENIYLKEYIYIIKEF